MYLGETMLKNFKKMQEKHQVICAIFIAFAVVSVWRGFWGLMDVYILPDNYHLSSWISLVVGLGILVVTHYAVKELI